MPKPQHVPLNLPPGVVRRGTQYASSGRWFDTHLVRWYQGVAQPIGGWQQLTGSALLARNDDFPAGNDITVEGGTTEVTTANAPSVDDKYTVHYSASITHAASEVPSGEARLIVDIESWDGAVWTAQERKTYTKTGLGTASFPHEDVTLELPGQAATEKIRLRVVTFTQPPVSASHAGVPDPIQGPDGSSAAILVNAPSLTNIYTVRYKVQLNAATGLVGGSSTIVLETSPDGNDPWTNRGTKVYTLAPGEQNRVWEDESISGTVAGLTPTAQIRLRIPSVDAGLNFSGASTIVFSYPALGTASFSLHGFNIATDADPHAGVTYATQAGSVVTLTGICRGVFASERGVSRAAYLMMGTHSKIYHFESGTLTDVTPAAGFTVGQADTTYGAGTSRLHGTATEATTWSLAEFVTANGVITPLACSNSDGKIWQQTFPGGNPGAMVVITPSAGTVPAGVRFIFVTPERFLVAVGETDSPRQIAWCKQDDLTNWDFSSTAPGIGAGANNLKGNGIPMCAVVGDGEHLILTDQELYAMRYVGGQDVYGLSQRGANCGIISRRAFASINTGTIVWMGAKQFFLYDGYVRPIPCEVADYVFNDINIDQAAKVWSMSLTQFGEVWWFYPSKEGTTSEIDRYVVWNYQTNVWYVGKLARLAGVDAGALQYPIMIEKSGANSVIYEHEKGLDRGTEVAYLESGPIEIGAGDSMLAMTQLIPDEKNLGDVDVRLYSRLHPTGLESVHGPFSTAEPTPVRITARQVRLRLEENVERDWRVGPFRAEVVPSGRR